MSKLPRAPDFERLSAEPPSLITIEPNQSLFRLYKRGGAYPTLWNQFRKYGPLSRFDHQLPDEENAPRLQDRGVLYAASDLPTAVAEFFQNSRRRIDRFDENPWVAAFQLPGKVQLLNLTDTFCVRVGASMKLTTGPFLHTQAWARGFYDAFPGIQGLYYQSSLTNRPTVVFYERVNEQDLFPGATTMHHSLDSPVMWKPLVIAAKEIGYKIT